MPRHEGDQGNPNEKTGGQTGGKTGGTSASATRPETGGKTGGETGGETKGTNSVSRQSVVEPRPTAVVLPGGEVKQPAKRGPKPGSKHKPKTSAAGNSETSLTVDQLSDTVKPVLYAGFGIVASRLGDHWQLSEAEAQSIADPTARILKRFESIEFIEKYMDYIALTVALGTAVGTRVIKSKEISGKEAQANGQPAARPNLAAVPKHDSQREAVGDSNPTPPPSPANVSGSLKESIPSMAL